MTLTTNEIGYLNSVTPEQWDEVLFEILYDKGIDWMLTVSGVHEAVSEELNNSIIDRLIEDWCSDGDKI